MTDAKQNIIDAMLSCKVPEITGSVDEALAAGVPPTDIIDTMGDAMGEIGIRFERGKLFLPHVLSAAAGMKKAMETLEPLLNANNGNEKKGIIAIGTVEGDVHDIGKSICATMLQCAGYTIHDLGRDVPNTNFIDEVKGGASFIGLSALMTTTMMNMPVIIGMIKDEGLRDKTKILIGGAPITQAYCDKIGADIYGESASETTRKVKELEA